MTNPLPAWKRLGLKLKYAKDESPNTTSTCSDGPTGQAGAHAGGFEQVERPAKRQRYSSGVLRNKTDEVNGESPLSTKPVDSVSPLGKVTNGKVPLQRNKKSVTFTNETKSDDGDSRTTIDFPAGFPASTSRKVNAKPEGKSTKHSEQIDVSNAVSSTPNGKQKKSEVRNKSRTTSTPREKAGPALEYLTQHRSHRSSWKFNKNRDVWILSHALDTASIPQTYVPALSGYIRGLPPTSGARVRLVTQCKQSLPELDTNNDVVSKSKEMLNALLQGDETIGTDFLKQHSRPEVLLWALGEDIYDSPYKSAREAATRPQVRPPVRKRKARVSAPIDISSSEEDSDSDSGSTSSASGADRGLRLSPDAHSIKAPRAEISSTDTSSSGSSSEDGDGTESSSDDSARSDSD